MAMENPPFPDNFSNDHLSITPVYPNIQAGNHVLDSGDMTMDHRDLLLAVEQTGPHHSSSASERNCSLWMMIIKGPKRDTYSYDI